MGWYVSVLSAGGLGQPGESGQCGESVVGSGPVCANGVEACAADDAAQDGGDDDGVVGVSEHRDEVGDQVDRAQGVWGLLHANHRVTPSRLMCHAHEQ